MVVLDIVLIGLIFGLLLSRRASNFARNVFLTSACFAIGGMAISTLGPFSTALPWLLLSVFLATFLLGLRAASVVVVGVVLVLGGVAIGIDMGAFGWAEDAPMAASRWMLTAFDFAFIVVVFAGANGLIIRVLEREDAARLIAESRLAEGRRNEALGTLAGGIAHDFNNLLVPVLVNLESVSDSLPVESPERAALQDAHRSARRARDLVQRILTFGRGVNSERAELDAGVIAAEVVAQARLAAPAGVRVECTREPVRVHASAAELHQVLQNLVTNATHAIPDGGIVTVDVRPVRQADELQARITVQDNGVGMSAETRERIFDPYFSTRPLERGTGLGLPIVRSIVSSLAGTIEVHSEPGEGSRFTVHLPALSTPAIAAAPTASATSPAPSAVALASGLRVLLVDDEDSVRKATARLLQSLGCVVTPCDGAVTALAVLDADGTDIDLLITDHRMPGQSGLSLVGEARSRHPELPMILMSGHIEEAAGPGTAPSRLGLLQKPFSRTELATAVQEVLHAV